MDDLLQFGDVEALLSMMESSQERQMIDLSLQAERYRGREATMIARPEDITMRQVGLGMAELDLFDLDLSSARQQHTRTRTHQHTLTCSLSHNQAASARTRTTAHVGDLPTRYR